MLFKVYSKFVLQSVPWNKAYFIKRHFNSKTQENELKSDTNINWQDCQQYGKYFKIIVNFGQGTRANKSFCERNRIPIRGHTFVGYSKTPDWFFKENFFKKGNYVTK